MHASEVEVILDFLSARAADSVCRNFFGIPPSRLSAEDLAQLRQILFNAYLPLMAELAVQTQHSVKPAQRRMFEDLLVTILAIPAELVPEKIRDCANQIVAEFGGRK